MFVPSHSSFSRPETADLILRLWGINCCELQALSHSVFENMAQLLTHVVLHKVISHSLVAPVPHSLAHGWVQGKISYVICQCLHPFFPNRMQSSCASVYNNLQSSPTCCSLHSQPSSSINHRGCYFVDIWTTWYKGVLSRGLRSNAHIHGILSIFDKCS